jgi:hypothetical protein
MSVLALTRIEARHLARSPLPWFAVVLALLGLEITFTIMAPTLAGDDVQAAGQTYLLHAGAFLLGARLALRDRLTATAPLLRATAAPAAAVLQARLLAVAAVTAVHTTVLFTAALSISYLLGGRGAPNAGLIAGTVLGVVLSGWAGAGLGLVLPNTLAVAATTPAWAGLCTVWFLNEQLHRLRPSLQWLSPYGGFGDRSVVLGFLPDITWPRLAWLAGLLAVTGAGLTLAVRRRDGGRGDARVMIAVAVLGLALAAPGGARLVAAPDTLLPAGPDPSSWTPVYASEYGTDGAIATDSSSPYPLDDLATTCVTGVAIRSCVYPAFGTRLAERLRDDMDPVAQLFRGFPHAPAQVRTIVSAVGACEDGTLLVPEENVRQSTYSPAERYLECLLGPGGHASDAGRAVQSWLDMRLDADWRDLMLSFQALEPVDRAAIAMDRLPPERVLAGLRADLDRLRAGTLPLAELPGGP